jgi:SAM-dependent methyltransferase
LGSYNEAVVNPNFIDIAKSNLNGLPVLFFKGDSTVIADSLQDNSFDLCFIDGDHNHPRVDSDIKNFLKKVKVGGCLSGHDLCNPEGDVFEALNSIIGSDYKDMIAYDDTGVPYAATTIWIHEVK